MPSCGERRRASGNLPPSTCLNPTNSCLACTLGKPEIETTNISTSALKFNAKYSAKLGAKLGAIKYGALGYDTLKHGTLINDVKATGAATATCQGGFDDEMTFGTVKKMTAINTRAFKYDALGLDSHDFGALDNSTLEYRNKKPAIEECSDIKQTNLRARVDVRAETRNNEPVYEDPSDWDPGGGPVKPQDFRLVAWWG